MAAMAQQYSHFEGYFESIPTTIARPRWINGVVSEDFNGDGFEDLLILGASYPIEGNTAPVNEPGMLLLGTDTSFAPAPQSLFPWQTLATVHPRKVLIEDFNGDGKPDVYIASHGWDTHPFPGEQNQLFLSSPTGWTNATATLPQLSDFTHTAAAGDIDGDSDLDIFAGNGYTGQNGNLAYMLMNDGAGHFTMTRANLPVAPGEVLDATAPFHFPGATFVDLNGDDLPELIATSDAGAPFDKLRSSVVLWNQGGRFDNAHKTFLPDNIHFPNAIVLDAAGFDVNLDGRRDLIVTGTQSQPYYDGWFVQVLLQQADGSFADATGSVMQAAERFGGTPGTGTGTPWGMWVKPLDINYDGFMDFSIEYGGLASASTPLVWINDGTGHFSTLRASDITTEYWRIGSGHWYETDDGWSIIHSQGYDAQNRIILAGVTATEPITATPDSGLARTGGDGRDRVRGNDQANTLDGGGDIDTAVYFANRADFTVARGGAGTHTVASKANSADIDTLVGVERIEFRDVKVAIDIDGHAGQVARILGAVFTPAAVGNAQYAGIGLDLLDGGMGYTQLLDLALQVALGTGATNEEVVTLLYTNVIGSAPSAADVQYFAGLIQDGTFTQASIAAFAADTDFNAERIGLTALAETGLAYL